MSASGSSTLNAHNLAWGMIGGPEPESLPEWAGFLVEVGNWIAELDDKGGRLFCAILLPSRILASSLVAFGALSNSLKNPSDAISWEDFLEYESGTQVYFLYEFPKKGKRQLEGALGGITRYGNESLREIHIDGKRKEHKNLTISLSKTRFKEASVSLHSHHRTALLNSLNNLADSYRDLLTPFNESRLLLSQEECMIVTNKAAWWREVEDLYLCGSPDSEHRSPLVDLLMLNCGRVKLCSPRNREIVSSESKFSILDGIDALRSKDNILSKKTLILLDRNEYQEEAEDLIYGFSDYCDQNVAQAIPETGLICPDSIDIQLYYFPGSQR